MRALVVVPGVTRKGHFSAPLAWLFSQHAGQVHGVFGWEINRRLVQDFDLFIIELNWFEQLYEFTLLVAYIRRHNPRACILFGGLFAALRYREVFDLADVDLMIKGDNEKPLRQLLDGVRPKEIANCVGKGFENPITYRFRADDYADLHFNLGWFPSYWRGNCCSFDTTDYPLPMIVTAKGGCPARHAGCEYCMGSKHTVLAGMYGRDIVTVSNQHLITLLHRIEEQFPAVTLMVISDPVYDLSGLNLDLDAVIELDCRASVDDIHRLMGAFKRTRIHVALYDEGLTGSSQRQDVEAMLALENANHQIRFFAFKEDLAQSRIPPDHAFYADSVLPRWADFKYYSDIELAYGLSRYFYQRFGATCLYRFPERLLRLIEHTSLRAGDGWNRLYYRYVRGLRGTALRDVLVKRKMNDHLDKLLVRRAAPCRRA